MLKTPYQKMFDILSTKILYIWKNNLKEDKIINLVKEYVKKVDRDNTR